MGQLGQVPPVHPSVSPVIMQQHIHPQAGASSAHLPSPSPTPSTALLTSHQLPDSRYIPTGQSFPRPLSQQPHQPLYMNAPYIQPAQGYYYDHNIGGYVFYNPPYSSDFEFDEYGRPYPQQPQQ
ncbi:hypothetical protein H1R20_g13426, partial [Candolleomyces eurysporus]